MIETSTLTPGSSRIGMGEGRQARYVLPAQLLHDLRTPLNHVIGYSQLLIENAQERGQSDLVPDIKTVLTAGGRLLSIINDNFYPTRSLQPDSATNGPKPANEPAPMKPADRAIDTEQGRLLVVDDDASNRDVLERRLKRQGYAVDTAENGRQALEMLRERTFDLVLLDIMMPEMDGFEVLKRLKADDRLQNIPIIMISAMSEVDSAVRCIELGAEDFLPKPFDPILLKARTVACLDRKRAHDREMRFTSDLQESYRRGLELERMRDDLIHMIVHDLRTPLSSVITGLQTMETMGELNEAQQETLDIALNGGQTLFGMINDLLDIGKMESGMLELDLKETRPADLVELALKQVEFLASAKNIKLATEIDADLPPIAADGEKLLRTLVNLLGNALKFTPSGGMGVVKIAVRRSEVATQSLLFFVSDNGEGIPQESFDRIFEKFGQVVTRTAGRKHSTGLGLAFCKLVVEAHGGRIWVESEMGMGSTFCFSIPLC